MKTREQLSKDYCLIESAIRFIEQRRLDQPPLAEIADEVGVSESHFQRLFTRWAGISPKGFLQYLTGEHARFLLEKSYSLLDTSHEVGLSGTGRLHDLTVKLYAMTPGEIKGLGSGLEISYGFHPTPFGTSVISLTERGICGLHFINSKEEALTLLRDDWPGAGFVEDRVRTGEIMDAIFPEGGTVSPGNRQIPLHVKGSNFQVKVWAALMSVPPGYLTSYGELAVMSGVAKGARAVGNAVGSNPVSYLIPCHRVIRKTGAFGNYRWGSARKLAIHVRESALCDSG